MKNKITPLCIFLICISSSIFGQNTIVNNFETGSPALVSRYGLSSDVTIVSNPAPGGLNITAKCAQVSRTTSNWYELFAFPANITIPANTKKYLHMKVNYYAQPDIAIRIDAANENADGGADIRALNTYTDLGNWQDLVFEMDGGTIGINVNAIVVLPDVGYNNIPVGQVLNNTDKFGYIDEISVSDSATPIVFNGNTMLNNFETGSPTLVSRYGISSDVTIVSNPAPGGLDTTANCAQVNRSTSNWYELFAFPVSFTIPANTKKYLHMLVNYYAQPDISIRIDAPDVNTDGLNPFRPLNTYTDLGNWQDLVFEMDGGTTGITVNAIQVHPDMGFNNNPAGEVLNNIDKFGFIDEISVNDTASAKLLGVNGFAINSSIALYPNPTSEILTISNLISSSVISIYSIDGRNVYNNINTNSNLSLPVKGWSKGVYIINIKNGNETSSKKFIVQ